MKWLPATGSTQGTEDKRYVIVKANSQDWVAYELTPLQTGLELGVTDTDERARALCEEHENMLVSLRKRA